MEPPFDSMAFGAPGIEPRWASSSKNGIGTARSEGCRLWFTLSHGIVNEIYYPTADQPNTRDFEFLISDGKTFCHEEKRLVLPWGFPGTQEVKRDALLNSEEEGKRGRIPY